jgi:predicted ArsR family transcriptional regulator
MKTSKASRRTPTTRVILLSLEQREELESLARKGTTQHRLVQRARMVLLRAEGIPLFEIGRRLTVHRNNVRRWCDRYIKKGLQGLFDRPRTGRPRSLSLRRNASR